LSEHGIKTTVIGNQNSKLVADALGSISTISPVEMAAITENISVEYNFFKKLVQNGRKLSELQIESLAQGQVWTGRQATQNGLVDGIGSFIDVLQKISPEQPISIITYKVKKKMKKKK